MIESTKQTTKHKRKQYNIKSVKILFSLSLHACIHAGRRQKSQQKVNEPQ